MPALPPSHDGVSQAVVDLLTALTEAEQDSMLSQLRTPLPALAKCSDHVRGILLGLETDRATREAALLALLTHVGRRPGIARKPDPDPFLPVLSPRFLLIKVAEAQTLLRSRYANALTIVDQYKSTTTYAEAKALIEHHHQTLVDGLARLERELLAMGLEIPPEL